MFDLLPAAHEADCLQLAQQRADELCRTKGAARGRVSVKHNLVQVSPEGRRVDLDRKTVERDCDPH